MASVVVQNIKVKHAGNIIIDTVPPIGTVLINNGDGYSKSKKVSLSLEASDATTDIKDIEVRNIDIETDANGNETQTVFDFVPLEYEENIFWNLNDKEGFKKVEVKFRDYAHNVSSFTSDSSVRKFFDLDTEEVNGLVRIGDDVYSSTEDEGRIYITRHYPKLLHDFDGETIKAILNNSNTLYVATNLSSTSKIYSYLDGSFVSLNTFAHSIVDVASYDGEIYVVLSNGDLYKKDSSAWMLLTSFSRPVLHIDGQADYLYILFSDSVDSIQLYNGTSFYVVDITDLFPESEVSEESSSSESSSLSSSTRAQSSSTQTASTSSSTERARSTSSVTVSESSGSTQIRSSSSTSSSLSSSSSIEQSSGLSSPSSESFSSESYLAQFSESSESSEAESSSESSSVTRSSASSQSSESSVSSGDICDCGRFVDNSLYIDQIVLTNLRDIYTYQCNLFGRLVNLGGGWLRVLFYKNSDRSSANEVARSEDFFQTQINKEVNINESNDSGIGGSFMYVSLFAGTIPSSFVVLCEGADTSSQSSLNSSSTSSGRSSSSSQDVMLGSGTQRDPFLVRTAENMVYVNANPNAYYRLVNDIDMSSVESSLMDEYVPIGSEVVPFEGYFDGYCHVIYNLSIDRTGEDNVGLFGYTKNATIRRLSLEDADIKGNNSVGALVGRAVGGTIEECSVYGGNVEGLQAVGGLIGYLDAGADILNSYSRNDNLTGVSTVGGLIGFRRNSASVVYTYSTSKNESGASNKGGLIGGAGAVAYAFSLQAQEHITHQGQQIDLDDSEGEVISSYWDVDATGMSSSEGGTGKTTSAMKTEGTFIGWDFSLIWKIQEGINDKYPHLRCSPHVVTENSSSSSTDVLELSSVSSSSTLYSLEAGVEATDAGKISSESTVGVLRW